MNHQHLNNDPDSVKYYYPSIVANEVEIETSDVKELINLEMTKSKKNIPFFEESDYANGAIYDELNYCWSQTITEIEIHIHLPESIRLGKHLTVTITSSNIKVASRITTENIQILNGILSEKCKSTEAMWTITAGNKLNIHIDKQKELWWKRLFNHEPDIDLNKIDYSRPIEELPEETQTELNRIQYDEQQKMKGEPTTYRLQQEAMLRRAWNVEGSPFSGTPFDPSLVQFENSS